VGLGLLIIIAGCGEGVVRGLENNSLLFRRSCAGGLSESCGSRSVQDVLLDIERESGMNNMAQKRAIKNSRSRLRKRGVAPFEVVGLASDRDLIRSLAKKLAQDDQEANRIRSEVMRIVCDAPAIGGILAALRRSPLVGADLIMERPAVAGRKA
jgi:hypothetical protein